MLTQGFGPFVTSAIRTLKAPYANFRRCSSSKAFTSAHRCLLNIALRGKWRHFVFYSCNPFSKSDLNALKERGKNERKIRKQWKKKIRKKWRKKMEKKEKHFFLILPCVYDFRTGGNNSFTRITFLRSLMFFTIKNNKYLFQDKKCF